MQTNHLQTLMLILMGLGEHSGKVTFNIVTKGYEERSDGVGSVPVEVATGREVRSRWPDYLSTW